MLSQTARRRFGKRERHVGENTTDTRRNRSNARIRKLDPLWEAYHPDVPSTLAKMLLPLKTLSGIVSEDRQAFKTLARPSSEVSGVRAVDTTSPCSTG